MGRLNDWYVADLLEILRKRGETVSAVESCTGGLLSARITDISGSSDVFRQSYVTYCDEAKHHLVRVKKSTLRKYTAVSQKRWQRAGPKYPVQTPAFPSPDMQDLRWMKKIPM